jgi:signal transduction histidine kinase
VTVDAYRRIMQWPEQWPHESIPRAIATRISRWRYAFAFRTGPTRRSMADCVFDTPEARAGSTWLASQASARRDDLLAALLSRFNHDLRTPLNTAIGWTHLLQQGLVDSTRSKHVFDVLVRTTREQTVLLNEFIDDGRAVLGVLGLDCRPLRVQAVLAQAIERAGPTLALYGATAKTIETSDAMVEDDEGRLQRLLHRLLVAVIHRARDGGVIELDLGATGGAAQLRIGAPAAAGDWSEATLLDLRISSFVAASHRAELIIDGAADRASIILRLPLLR